MPVSREDAETVAEFLVLTGRAVTPSKWVDSLIGHARDSQLESIF